MSDKSKNPPAALVPAEKLDSMAVQLRTAVVAAASGKLTESLALAQAVQQLRELVVKVVPMIRPLIGTPLGFRTDRDTSDKGMYSESVIADCLVEAIGRGLRWTGNELNIIGGRCYTTKEGYTRLVAELPGLTDLELQPGIPRVSDGGAIVKYRATWNLDGKPFVLEREIPVRLNAGMGADGALGKATRKMYAAIHGRVTGSIQSLADSDAEDVEAMETAKSKTASLAERLSGHALLPPAARVTTPPVATTAKTPSHVPGVDEEVPATGNPSGKLFEGGPDGMDALRR